MSAGPKPGPELGPRVGGLRVQSGGLWLAVLGGPTRRPRKGGSERGSHSPRPHGSLEAWWSPSGPKRGLQGRRGTPWERGFRGGHPVAWRPQERPQRPQLRIPQKSEEAVQEFLNVGEGDVVEQSCATSPPLSDQINSPFVFFIHASNKIYSKKVL